MRAMSRAVKPDKKPREVSLTSTEAYNLRPAQEAFQHAEDQYRRAVKNIQSIAHIALERAKITDTDLERWNFDVRDDGVFLVEVVA